VSLPSDYQEAEVHLTAAVAGAAAAPVEQEWKNFPHRPPEF